MPRAKRCEFQGAIYLVTVTGYADGHVFYDPQIFKQFPDNPRAHAPDTESFQNLMWDVCEQYEARVHGYVIEPNVAQIVLQTLGAPLGWVVHDLVARYSRHLIEHNRTPQDIRPFPRRYKAQIVQPAKLPYVVRYVQRREIPADRRRRAINHPFTSSLIYCGRRPQPDCFIVSATREALGPLGYLGPTAYFEFMAGADSPSIAHLLSRRVIGERRFVDSLRERSRRPHRAPSPDEILREVTGTVLHTEPDIACTSTHLGALARALVAWYAMRTGTAQIGAVARWFDVTSSDLRYLIRTHRRKSPHYFCVPTPELFPAFNAAAAECSTSPMRPPALRSAKPGTASALLMGP